MVDADGNLTPAWRGFFQSLYTRTGGSAGTDASGFSAGLDAEAAARAATDVSLATAIASERSERQSADNAISAAGDATKLPLTGGTVSGPLTVLGQTRANGGFGALGAAAVISRPVVTGAKAGNAALTSLLVALVSYGLVQDTTT